MYNQLSDDRPRKLQSALDKLAHKERLIKAWEPVIKAAKAWLAKLEADGGHYRDGIPGELMDAVEALEEVESDHD